MKVNIDKLKRIAKPRSEQAVKQAKERKKRRVIHKQVINQICKIAMWIANSKEGYAK